MHQLVVGALEEADRALAEVRGDVELVPPLVDHFHFPGLEGQQRLFATPHNNRKIQTTKTKNVPPPKKKNMRKGGIGARAGVIMNIGKTLKHTRYLTVRNAGCR